MNVRTVLLAVAGVAALGLSPSAGEEWNCYKSTHFLVNYKAAGVRFVEQLAAKAEGYYNEITDDLGFRRFDFWLWDNRALIYVYDDAADFQTHTGQPAWSMGAALPTAKAIYTFVNDPQFTDAVLAHELRHIIFRELVGFSNAAVPVWLDEGVASYHRGLDLEGLKASLAQVAGYRLLMSAEQIGRFNPQYAAFDTSRVEAFYLQSVSMVYFLIKKYGQDDFVSFCQYLRDYQNLDGALRTVYSFSDTAQFLEAWRKYFSLS